MSWLVGPWRRRDNTRDGTINPIPPHHIPMAVLGTVTRACGWFGFNPGSTLGVSGGGPIQLGSSQSPSEHRGGGLSTKTQSQSAPGRSIDWVRAMFSL
jgi:Ammonium Transporter Family